MRSIANEEILPNIVSKIFERDVLLSMIAARGGGDKELRPGGMNLVGGGNLSRARRSDLRGGESVKLPNVLTGTVGGTKHMSNRDTGPTVANPTTNTAADKWVKPFVRKCKTHTPILVWNTDTENAKNDFQIIDAIESAVNLAMEEQADEISEQLIDGTVVADTADVWQGQYGLTSVCNTTNTIYGIDRSLGTYFDGNRVTASTSAALAMIDAQNVAGAEIYKTGPGIDTLILNPTSYNKIKAEALANNGTLLHRGTQQAVELGIIKEAVMYGGVIITVDYGLDDYSAAASSGGLAGTDLSAAGFGLTIGDFVMRTEPGAAWSAGEFVNLEDTVEGGKDAAQSILRTHWEFWCEKPWNQVLWTTLT